MPSSRLARAVALTALASLLVAGLPAAAYEVESEDNWEGLIPESDGAFEVGFAETVYPMVFPHLAGEYTSMPDTFGACRGTGCSRSHHGIDIMAPKMVPIVAVASGTVGWMHDDQGGNCCAMALRHDDGWESWYIHMNNDTPGTDDGQGWGFAEGITSGVHVEAGQLIGWVGDSGNAEWTGSHTHFELHDPNGTIINPYLSLLAATIIYQPLIESNPAGCDFDADGHDDLVVGVPGEDRHDLTDDGTVVVIPGGEVGPDTLEAELWHQRSRFVQNKPETDDRFGSSSTCGDIDGDGYADLVIGVPGEDQWHTDVGAVNVLYGSPAGLEAVGTNYWHQKSVGVPGKHNEGDEFGAALASADFNGDGYADVVVGIPGEILSGEDDAGSLLVFAGHPSGFGVGSIQRWNQRRTGTVGTAEAGDRFAESLAVGDFNGDGYADLAAGAPGDNGDSGMVMMLFGSESGLTLNGTEALIQGVDGLAGGEEVNDRFGAALAAADFDGDGYADLAVGVPGQDTGGFDGAGAVHIVPGSAAGMDRASDYVFSGNGTELPAGDGYALGTALAAAVFTPDGFADLAVGAPGWNSGAGAVGVVDGSWQGLDFDEVAVFHQDTAAIDGAPTAGDDFGRWLSSGDFIGQGSSWLVIGVPSEDLLTKVDVGAIHVLPGGLGGVSAYGSHYILQNTEGMPGSNNPGDAFGHLGKVGR
jgi:hypothetical protein